LEKVFAWIINLLSLVSQLRKTTVKRKEKVVKPQSIIAATFGWCVSEMSEYRYKQTRTSQPIYSIGNKSFAVGKNKPREKVESGEWTPYVDQFWAAKSNTVLWVSVS
jgi:hypothetical protein